MSEATFACLQCSLSGQVVRGACLLAVVTLHLLLQQAVSSVGLRSGGPPESWAGLRLSRAVQTPRRGRGGGLAGAVGIAPGHEGRVSSSM
eukprot:8985979-Alexandrium_andersonii.AAC.2